MSKNKNIFIVSDVWFNRPIGDFSSMTNNEYNNMIIDNWNNVVDKKDVVRGQVLAKPNSITPHTKFEAQLYVLSKEEGGRHSPFFSGYRPQFYFRTTDITGTVNLEAGVDMVKPGDNVKIIGELIHPIAMDEGLKLAIREGGRTIASGQVTKIIE